jgi:purine nucleosidase
MRRRRIVRRLTVGCLFLLACMLATLALPVPVWRTGRISLPPLAVSPARVAPVPARIWIDTDPACGHTPRTDVDDCLALWLLGSRYGRHIAGVSTVHGNAPLPVTDHIARQLIRLTPGARSATEVVHRGLAVPMAAATVRDTPARIRLTQALEAGPLTILALGPLTNVAGVLRARPDLRPNVEQVVAVMGRRSGHLFHPAEGNGRGSLFGHGPVFRDFNFNADPDAAAVVTQMDLPLTLIPYDAATQVEITRADLRHLAAQDEAGEWIADRAKGWLDYWETHIGTAGFYPFDLMAAVYVVSPSLFRCADVRAWVGADPMLFVPLFRPTALLVEPREQDVKRRAVYCPQVEHRFRARLRQWMFSPV